MEVMELGKTALKNESMSDSIKSIYEGLYKLLCIHCKVNMYAMASMQMMGYNGFKRWHRYRCKQLHDMKIELVNGLYDKFMIAPSFKDYEVSYSPDSMETHLKTWTGLILDAMQSLGKMANDYCELTGMSSGIINRVLDVMSWDYEKAMRYQKRFVESDWLTLDMHMVDDKLHKKFKKKEMECAEWKKDGEKNPKKC